MKQTGLLVMVGLLGACGDGSSAPPDAFVPQDAPSMCPAKMPPLNPGTRTLYINTEGVTLTKGDCNNAQTNCTSLIMPSQVTVPPFMDGVATRQGTIDLIVGYVQRALGPWSVDVVTTRPTSGDYWMEVLGGDSTTIIGANSLSLALAVCDASAAPNAIALAFESGVDVKRYANSIISDFGATVGLSVTNVANDCMCRASSNCGPAMYNNLICTFGTNVTTDPVHDCGRIPTQDEQMLLAAALGCRP